VAGLRHGDGALQLREERTDVKIITNDWKWFGYPGHLIVADMCRFSMCTQVGEYLISTVGDYWPDGERGKRRTIGGGDDSFFETYVFKAGPPCAVKSCGCGQPTIDGSEIDGERCATAGEARELHMKYCEKYAREQP